MKPQDSVVMPSMQIPTFRTQLAIQRGVEKNLLIRTWGGIGDQICAEPTLRFALDNFRNCRITLASEIPELFDHLNFDAVIDLRKEKLNADEYICFDTIRPNGDLTWEFMSHMIVNCVDYPSLCAFRGMIPIAYKSIQLQPPPAAKLYAEELIENDKRVNGRNWVCVHPGKHWQSKTFPKSWWDAVLSFLILKGIVPVLIGANSDANRGTVDVDTSGCLDLRNKLSIMESVAMLQRCPVLLTNDSSPLHMAASGDAWIGFVATCKHPDYISHWRKGEWSWRMENLGLGGIWEHMDFCPNKGEEVKAEVVAQHLLSSWLPQPYHVADWAATKLRDAYPFSSCN